MNTKTVKPMSAFDARQRSLAATAFKFQGRAVSIGGYPVAGTLVHAVKPVGVKQATWQNPARPLGTTGTTDPRLRRTSPL
ncbi:MAG: hypothetical protein AAGC49_08145 [Brevundimonas sp.]